jgi:hypothetical protein
VFRLRLHKYEAGDKVQILIPPVTQADPGAGLHTKARGGGLIGFTPYRSVPKMLTRLA